MWEKVNVHFPIDFFSSVNFRLKPCISVTTEDYQSFEKTPFDQRYSKSLLIVDREMKLLIICLNCSHHNFLSRCNTKKLNKTSLKFRKVLRFANIENSFNASIARCSERRDLTG